MKVEIKNGKIKGYITIKETAEKWLESRSTIYQWLRSGKIPQMYVIKLSVGGKNIYFIKEDCPKSHARQTFSRMSTGYVEFKLTEKEDQILRLIEEDHNTFAEISKKLNISSQYANAVYCRALAKILKQGKSLEEYLKNDEEVSA